MELNQIFVSKIIEKKEQAFNEEYKGKVEMDINELCLKILEHYKQKMANGRNWEKTFTTTVQTIASKAYLLDPKVTSLNPVHAELQKMRFAYYEELSEGISLLEKFRDLWHQRCNHRAGYASLLDLRAAVLDLKIKIFKYELFLRTYTEDAVGALKIINQNLDAAGAAAAKELQNLRLSLEAYQVLGPKYERLVEEYATLAAGIEEERWMISEMNKKPGGGGG